MDTAVVTRTVDLRDRLAAARAQRLPRGCLPGHHRIRPHHGRLPRRAPLPHASRPGQPRLRGRVAVREPPPVRAGRGPRPLPAGPGRRPEHRPVRGRRPGFRPFGRRDVSGRAAAHHRARGGHGRRSVRRRTAGSLRWGGHRGGQALCPGRAGHGLLRSQGRAATGGGPPPGRRPVPARGRGRLPPGAGGGRAGHVLPQPESHPGRTGGRHCPPPGPAHWGRTGGERRARTPAGCGGWWPTWPLRRTSSVWSMPR